METHPPREDLWVFGYGSLMWKPEFPFLERHAAHVHGFHRSFCVYSHVYRGTRARPGLVLALDSGGSCRGVAYRVAADSAAAVVERLVRREMVTCVYLPRWVAARLPDGRRVRAHTYTAAHDHEQYAGKLAAAEAARIIRGGIGRSGHNLDYLRSTVAHLAELGIVDRALVRIAELAGAGAKTLSAPDAGSSIIAMDP
ncbi:MAG: gamma-glutamylcyclotransferase [Alphaproteobacteria bacterium]|nr:gamma-glutamylcyclotransferase [Alphaproteobacteria bacterium]